MSNFLIFTWVFIIPLIVMTEPFLQKIFKKQNANFLPRQKELKFSKEKRREIWKVLFRVFAVLFVIPLFFIQEFRKSHSPISMFDVLSFVLIAEMLAFDFMTIAFYLDKEKKLIKKILCFLFVFVNFWMSVIWVIKGKIPLIYLISSVICYPMLGLNCIYSYYLKEGCKDGQKNN